MFFILKYLKLRLLNSMGDLIIGKRREFFLFSLFGEGVIFGSNFDTNKLKSKMFFPENWRLTPSHTYNYVGQSNFLSRVVFTKSKQQLVNEWL